MDEIWKDILDYEGYQASNEGRVKSLGNNKTRKEKILKPFINKGGYQHVQLWKNGKAKTFLVHRLVYAAFCGEIPDCYDVNHINECKTDNRLSNLNLMTRKENINWGTHNERVAKALKNDPQMSKPVVGYDADGDVVITFPSTQEAERNGYNSGAVSSCCRGKKPQYKGLIWRYANGNC